MNTLEAQRLEIQTALLSAGMAVEDHLPERLAPPLAIIAAGSPYLEGGSTYGSFTARFTVVLICAQGTNATVTKDLDREVTTAVIALDDADFGLERVDQPTMLQHGGGNYLSTTLDIRRDVTGITDGEA